MRSALVLLVAGMMACATTGGGIGGDTGPSGDAMRTDTGGSDGAHDGGSMSDAHDGAIGDTGMMDVSMTDTGHMDSGPMDTGPTDTGPGDTGPTDAGPCSSCPTGFSCGAGGYCVNADGVPAFGHVFLLVMENHSLSSILGSTDAPYLNTLMSTYLYATHYVTRASSPIHPSCPNYIALTSGDTFGIDCDCSPASPSTSARLSCAFASTSSSCPQAAMHVGDMLDAASVPWREYGEDMGTPCNTTDNANYVARHIPFLYYDDVRTDSARCTMRVRDYAADFSADLTAGTYRFSMISPNLCHDMHGNGVAGFGDSCTPNDTRSGDDWLRANVPTILGTPGFHPGGTDVLFIVWDEEDGSTGSEPLPLIIISPLVRMMSTTPTPYDHYALLATIEEGLGAMRVGSTEALAATPIHDVWR